MARVILGTPSAPLVVLSFGLAAAAASGCAPGATRGQPNPGLPAASAPIQPVVKSATVPHDPDDPAIWIHPTDPSKTLVLGTDKQEVAGGLYAFRLDGSLSQSIPALDRPNNVDVEYGFRTADGQIDIAALTERKQHRLRVFGISRDNGTLHDIAPAGLPVLEGLTGEASEPMGIALYKRPKDGAIFAIVAPKTGEATDYLWQYRLEAAVVGQVTATLVRRFGRFSQNGEIEAVVVDDELGYVYYSDETWGIRKYHADPDHPDAALELATIGRDGYEGDREGLAIYARGDRTGFLVSADQVSRRSRLKLYPREGAAGQAHEHPELRTLLTVSDATDGLEVTSTPLPGFPQGLLVMMNSAGKNFLIYDWRTVMPPTTSTTER